MKDLKRKDKALDSHIDEYNATMTKVRFHHERLEKEVHDKDEIFDAKVQRIERNMTNLFNNQRKQLENKIQKQNHEIERLELDLSSKFNQINLQLMKIDDRDVVHDYIEEQLISTKKLFQMVLDRMKEDFDEKLHGFATSNF